MTNEDFMIQTAEYLSKITGVQAQWAYDFLDHVGVASEADLCAIYLGDGHKECLMFLENELRSYPWDPDAEYQFEAEVFEPWLERIGGMA
jgi:hypothetical protein